MKIIEKAVKKGQKALSEYESKKFLASYKIPTVKEGLATNKKEAVAIAKKIGFPVVLKGCAPEITHKTELNLVKLNISNEKELASAYKEIQGKADALDGVLVQKMVKAARELVIGLTRDPQFGPCVMFGLGGIMTEILKDVSFRVAPLELRDAREMVREIKAHKILDDFRGEGPVDLDILCNCLISVGKIGLDYEQVKEIDINPLLVAKGKPVAVDALVVLQ
ncbi:MAG: acetate--CoA ligase family protein [Deltaproteobacteria bacterium]|nr:MAG: acetate--CoA ligase family protein [Deltaproteobacteria bacterium]